MVIIVFGIAFFGFIDGVRLVYLNSTLSQAAREGARLASVEASWVGSTDPGLRRHRRADLPGHRRRPQDARRHGRSIG